MDAQQGLFQRALLIMRLIQIPVLIVELAQVHAVQVQFQRADEIISFANDRAAESALDRELCGVFPDSSLSIAIR